MKPRNNPFSTERTDRLSYRYVNLSHGDLMSRLKKLNYRAAIVGPDGSGKTTLLAELKHFFQKNGHITHSVFINDQNPFTRNDRRRLIADLSPASCVFMDGADHLGKFFWQRLKSDILRYARGLVITSHKPHLLPTLIECPGNFNLFFELTSELSVGTNQLNRDQLALIYKQHSGNIRDCFRHLYDIYAALTPITT